MCCGTTVICFDTEGRARSAWLGQNPGLFLPVGCAYVSLATVKSQI